MLSAQASWWNETVCDSGKQSQRSRQLCHLCTQQKERHEEIPQLVFIQNLVIVPRLSAGNSLSCWEWSLQSVDLVPNPDLGARCLRQILTSEVLHSKWKKDTKPQTPQCDQCYHEGDSQGTPRTPSPSIQLAYPGQFCQKYESVHWAGAVAIFFWMQVKAGFSDFEGLSFLSYQLMIFALLHSPQPNSLRILNIIKIPHVCILFKLIVCLFSP